MQLGLELTQLGLELLQTRLGRVEGFGDAVSLGADARVLFALVSIAVTSLLGFVFPLISTVCLTLESWLITRAPLNPIASVGGLVLD